MALSVSPAVLTLIQQTNDVSSSPNLNQVDHLFVEKIELDALAGDAYAKQIIKVISEALGCSIQNHEKHRRIRTACAEAKIYYRLRARLHIERVPEQGAKEVKTPDFKIVFGGEDFYAEIKAPDFVGGNRALDQHMHDALDAKVRAEEGRRRTGCGIGEHVVTPWGASAGTSPKLLCERLIDKIDQNTKRDQWVARRTLLIVDLPPWHLPLPSRAADEISPGYACERGRVASGVLWHVAFGAPGQALMNHVADPWMAGALDPPLSREGILTKYSELVGLVFQVGEEFFALARHDDVRTVKSLSDLLPRFVTAANDERDSLRWHFGAGRRP